MIGGRERRFDLHRRGPGRWPRPPARRCQGDGRARRAAACRVSARGARRGARRGRGRGQAGHRAPRAGRHPVWREPRSRPIRCSASSPRCAERPAGRSSCAPSTCRSSPRRWSGASPARRGRPAEPSSPPASPGRSRCSAATTRSHWRPLEAALDEDPLPSLRAVTAGLGAVELAVTDERGAVERQSPGRRRARGRAPQASAEREVVGRDARRDLDRQIVLLGRRSRDERVQPLALDAHGAAVDIGPGARAR